MTNAYCYCQRTREGRITVGARGVPYKFGSSLDKQRRTRCRNHPPPDHDPAPPFPRRREPIRIDHAWCGVLGVPRDWCATVGLDQATGIGWAGGYVGVGVSTSNLAGPHAGRSRPGPRHRPHHACPGSTAGCAQWEPEPLRWLGVHGMYKLLRHRRRPRNPAWRPALALAAFGNWLTGR